MNIVNPTVTTNNSNTKAMANKPIEEKKMHFKNNQLIQKEAGKEAKRTKS